MDTAYLDTCHLNMSQPPMTTGPLLHRVGSAKTGRSSDTMWGTGLRSGAFIEFLGAIPQRLVPQSDREERVSQLDTAHAWKDTED